jgi:hypothetical protein
MLSGSLDSRVTFSRGSNATLVDGTGRIVYAPANLLLRSEEFNDAAWTKVAASVITNATTAPNGTMTAEKLVENTATSSHFVSQSGGDIGDTETFSVYAKRAERFWVRLTLGGESAFFNLDDGTASPSNASTIITPVGDGWYRCSMTRARNSSNLNLIYTALSSAPSSSYTGDGVSGIFIWGAQRELATYQTVPGPYVATTSAAYYGPRFDYNPVTLAPLGLLIEEQRANLLLYSQQLDNAAWTKVNATVTANATVAPDGTSTADTLVEDATNNFHNIVQTAGTVGVVETFSAYVKPAGRSWIAFQCGSSVAYFNVSTGVVGNLSSATASIQNAGNGWYRCSMTMTRAGGTGTGVLLASANGTASYTGDGISGVFLWGIQLEAGSFATSYIPTVASQVTRNADVATMTGTNFSSWYNQPEGTFFVDCAPIAVDNDIALSVSNSGGYNNSIYVPADSASQFIVVNGGVVQVSIDAGTVTASAANRIAGTYKLNDFAASVGGGAVVTDTSGTLPTVDRAVIGGLEGNTANRLNGHIRQIAYFNSRLPNAQLQALTAPPLITSLSLDFINGVYEG